MTTQINHSSSDKYLIIEVGHRLWGIPTTKVREIVSHTTVEPSNHMPPFVVGMSQIRHKPCPIIDLNLLLGGDVPTEVHAESCYVVVLLWRGDGLLPTPACLFPDRVVSAHRITAEEIDPVSALAARNLAAYLMGVGRMQDGNRVMLLDVDQLLLPYLDVVGQSDVHPFDTEQNTTAGGTDELRDIDTLAQRPRPRKYKVLSIQIAGGWYAIPVSSISLITGPEQNESAQEADVPGILSEARLVNDQVTGVVRLSELLVTSGADNVAASASSNPASTGDRSRHRETTILVAIQGQVVGLIVDSIGPTYEVKEDDLIENSFYSDATRARIKSLGFIEIETGSLEVIDPMAFLAGDEIEQIRVWQRCIRRVISDASVNKPEKNPLPSNADSDLLNRMAGSYLVVKAGAELIGLRCELVREILANGEVVGLPGTPEDFAGLLDLRAHVHPVINLRMRLDVEQCGATDVRQCVVLLSLDGGTMGILVDEVIDICRIGPQEVARPENSRLFVNPECLPAVAKRPEGLIHLIDVKRVLGTDKVSARGMLKALRNRLDDGQGQEALCK